MKVIWCDYFFRVLNNNIFMARFYFAFLILHNLLNYITQYAIVAKRENITDKPWVSLNKPGQFSRGSGKSKILPYFIFSSVFLRKNLVLKFEQIKLFRRNIWSVAPNQLVDSKFLRKEGVTIIFMDVTSKILVQKDGEERLQFYIEVRIIFSDLFK